MAEITIFFDLVGQLLTAFLGWLTDIIAWIFQADALGTGFANWPVMIMFATMFVILGFKTIRSLTSGV